MEEVNCLEKLTRPPLPLPLPGLSYDSLILNAPLLLLMFFKLTAILSFVTRCQLHYCSSPSSARIKCSISKSVLKGFRIVNRRVLLLSIRTIRWLHKGGIILSRNYILISPRAQTTTAPSIVTRPASESQLTTSDPPRSDTCRASIGELLAIVGLHFSAQ